MLAADLDGGVDRGGPEFMRSVGPISLNIWLCDLTYTQQSVSADLIPQAIGGIATFAEANLALRHPIRLFKYPEVLISVLENEGCPDVIGFSNYIWNSSLSYAFAERIKEIRSDTVVVFGGPNFPTDPVEAEAFLQDWPAVDFLIVKEGEVAFANLVAGLAQAGGRPEALQGRIRSVHSIDRSGRYHAPPTAERLRDLTVIPSPYLSGKLDEFFDGKLVPIVQTNRGCPFTCTFCVEGVTYYNKVYRNAREKVASELDYIGRRMAEVRRKGGRNDLFIADSNFGMYKEDIETCQAIAGTQRDYGWPEYINVATGKNQKERVLSAARLINGALRLSGSVQSLDPEVLSNIRRSNIAPEKLMNLALEAADVGANSYCETILCLPGDTKERHRRTLETVINAGFNMVSTFQLMLLPGSEMCTRESRETFGMESRFRVFPRCFGAYEVAGRPLIAAEIEEVCVALKELPFEDYLECRLMHLMIALFYNDSGFGALLRFLRRHGLSVYRWIELLSTLPAGGGLKALFDAYLQATRDELWPNRASLMAFLRQPGTIQRYIDGEIGNNLLFTYKTLALTRHAEELGAFALEATRHLLAETGQDRPEYLAFVEEAARYQVCRMTRMFGGLSAREAGTSADKPVEGSFSYDIRRYEEESGSGALASYTFEQPRRFRFIQDSEQRNLISRYLSVFGDTPHGIGRMMTKVYVRKLFRQPVAMV